MDNFKSTSVAAHDWVDILECKEEVRSATLGSAGRRFCLPMIIVIFLPRSVMIQVALESDFNHT